MFIVSKFTHQKDIDAAVDFIKLCRNHFIFITVITPARNDNRDDLMELKDRADIFLLLMRIKG